MQAPPPLSDPTKDMIRLRSSQIVLIEDTKGLGTGLLVGPDGWVLTNKHVAPSVGPYRVILANGKDVRGIGVHQSAHHDLAVVKIAVACESFLDLTRDVAEDYHVGEEVYALGHPRGCRFSVARGIISNPHREIDKEHYVQTDVSINPGNSGGPLVDRTGNLVGIVTMMLANAQGLGFAVPGHAAADYVRHVRRLVRQNVVRVPEALLEAPETHKIPAEEIVRNAVNVLVQAGKVAIEAEQPEEGRIKLKNKGAIIDVVCAGGHLGVSAMVAALGPSELGDARFLARLLELSGSRELGGACFSLRDGALHVGLVRPTAGLDGLEAVGALDLVVYLAAEWPTKIAALLFGGPVAAPPAAAGPLPEPPLLDPGYPILTMPSPEAWQRR
jgi:S1-C subfamily serine protease